MANAVGGQPAELLVCRLLLRRRQKDKTFLPADLIIDKVLINSASWPYCHHTNIASLAMSSCVCDRRANERVGADEMCRW